MAAKLPEGITNNNRINLVSMLADYDESTSSSRPTTPSILTAFVTRASTEPRSKSDVDLSNTEKISINKLKKSKKFKKLNKKVKRKRKDKMNKLKDNGLDSNIQNDGLLKEDKTTNVKKKLVKPKPVFDLAGNIITPTPVSLFPFTTTDKSGPTPISIKPVVTEGPEPKTSTPSPDKIVHSLSSAGIPTTTPSGVPDEASLPSTTTQKEENNESTSLKPTIITKTQIDKLNEKSIKENIHNATKSDSKDSKDINIFINIVQDKKKKRKEKWKRKQARLLKCPAKDLHVEEDIIRQIQNKKSVLLRNGDKKRHLTPAVVPGVKPKPSLDSVPEDQLLPTKQEDSPLKVLDLNNSHKRHLDLKFKNAKLELDKRLNEVQMPNVPFTRGQRPVPGIRGLSGPRHPPGKNLDFKAPPNDRLHLPPRSSPNALPLKGDVVKRSRDRNVHSKLDCGNEFARDFRNSPDGYKCCLKSAKCFENLPEDLDETSDVPHNEDSNHVNSDTRACGQIDHALLCMSGILAKPKCKATADIVNKDLKEELIMVKTFYKNHCSHSVHTTPPLISRQPGGQEGHEAPSNTESSPVSAALFGGVAGGAVLLLIVLIAVIVCMVRRKRSSNPPRDDKAVFQTQASTTSTRYKEFIRRNSDVYAEIDERHLQRSFRLNSESTFETTEDSGGSYPGRPLPNAPSEYTTEETNGYLTPRASKEELNKKGYDELSTLTLEDNSSAESYDKLTMKKLSSSQPTGNGSKEKSTDVTEHNGDGDYITPNTDGPIQEKPTDTYHMYFVLEKQ